MSHATLFLLLFTSPALADWQSRYRTGEQLLTQGKAEEALTALSAALAEAVPAGRGSILDALGRAEHRSGRYRQAKSHFEAALRLWPVNSPERATSASRRLPTALPSRLWPVNSPERATVFYNLGRACLELQEHTYAEEMFRRTLESGSGEAYVWQAIGQAQFHCGRKDAAEDSFRKAISLSDPINRPMIVSDLAMLLLAKRQYDKAAAIWREAIGQTGPGQVRARMLHSLGVLQWACNQKDQAAVQLRLALAEMEAAVGPRHPEVASILEYYQEVLRRSGKKAEATAAAERALAIRSSFAAQGGDRRNSVDWRAGRAKKRGPATCGLLPHDLSRNMLAHKQQHAFAPRPCFHPRLPTRSSIVPTAGGIGTVPSAERQRERPWRRVGHYRFCLTRSATSTVWRTEAFEFEAWML